MDDKPSLFVLGSFVIACSAQVTRFPQPGESAFALSFVAEPGGKGFNVAAGLHKLGVPVDGLFAVGDDPFAALARAALAEVGLSLGMLRDMPGQTGSGIGFVDTSGETCLAVFPGANALLEADAVRDVADRLERAPLVLAQFEIPDAPIVEGFRRARAAGGRTILNPSPFRVPPGELLDQTSIVIVNEIEALALRRGLAPDSGGPTNESAEDAAPVLARSLFDRGSEMLIVTLGRRGARLYAKDGAVLFHPAFPVEAVDALGAGDAFIAGFAAGFFEGMPLGKCLRRASACGALATRRHGVLKALATRRELDVFLEEHARLV